MKLHLLALVLGFLLDLSFGDPLWLYHPVRAVGLVIGWMEKLLRRIFPKTKGGELDAGALFAFLVLGVCTAVPALVLFLADRVSPWLGFALCVFWDYQLLATKSLKMESMKVYKALKAQDLPGARHAVSMIVGRDTEELTEEGVARAAVETVAENTSDGIVAPMIFLAVGGPVFGFFYKTVNTMDSMVGYKNDKYRYFGTFAARLDDAVNLIPARLSGALMVLAACVLGMDGKNAWKIFLRDRRNHSSPNSAHTEAAAAGALDVQLAGNARYFGKLCEKPTIGDAIRPVEYEDIRRVNRLLYGTAVLALILLVAVGLLADVLIRLL